MAETHHHNRVELGTTRYEGDKQQPVLLDVDESKHGLITGSTGSGKSNTLRVLVEEIRGVKTQNGGKVHVAVFDTEGDLRPALEMLGDFAVFDMDGPHQITPETAAIIAREQVKHGFDAIFDLTDWGSIDRGEIIAAYSQALADLKLEQAPRAYGRKLFVFYDEAQKYTPELSKQQKGVDYPAAPAIINLVNVGRKRGISAWVATLRPAKVRADIRSECDIIIAGKLNRSDDRETVLKEMGVAAKERGAIAEQMRRFKKGDCLIIGDGLFDEPTPAHIKKGRTEVPEDYGIKPREAPPMSEAMQQVVAQLADIKQRAKKEARDLDEARAFIHELKNKLERLETTDRRALEEKVERLQREVEHYKKTMVQGTPRSEVLRLEEAAQRRGEEHVHAEWLKWADEEQNRHYAVQKSIETALLHMPQKNRPGNRSHAMMDSTPETPPRAPPTAKPNDAPVPIFVKPDPGYVPSRAFFENKGAENGGRRPRHLVVLDTAASLGLVPRLVVTVDKIAGIMGVHPRGGSFLQEFKTLAEQGLIERNRDSITVTPEGYAQARPRALPKSVEEAASGIEGRTKLVFTAVAQTDNRDGSITKGEVARTLGVNERGGSFLQEFKKLADRGLIEDLGHGRVRLAEWLRIIEQRAGR